MPALFVPVCESGCAGNPLAAMPDHGGGQERRPGTRAGPGTLHRTGRAAVSVRNEVFNSARRGEYVHVTLALTLPPPLRFLPSSSHPVLRLSVTSVATAA